MVIDLRRKIWELLETKRYDELDQLISSHEAELGFLTIRARVEMMVRAGKLREATEYLEKEITHTDDLTIQHFCIANVIRLNAFVKEIKEDSLEEIQKEVMIAERCTCDIKNEVLGEMYRAYGDCLFYIKQEISSAIEYYQKSIAIFEKLDDEYMVFYLRNKIAVVYKDAGLYDEALLAFEENKEFASTLSTDRGMIVTVGNIASVKLECGELNEAQHVLMNLLEYMDESDGFNRGVLYMKLGKISRLKGDYGSSLKELTKADELLEQFTSLRAENLVNLALTNFALGNIEQAELELKLSQNVSLKCKYFLPLAISTYLLLKRGVDFIENLEEVMEVLNSTDHLHIKIYNNLIAAVQKLKIKRSFRKILALKDLEKNYNYLRIDIFAAIETLILSSQVLLLEYSLTESVDILKELTVITEHLITIAKENNLPDLKLRINLLSIRLDIDDVPNIEILDKLDEMKAETTSREIIEEIEKLRADIEKRIDEGLGLESKGSKLIDQLRQNEIMEYLRHIAESNIINLYLDDVK